MIVAIAENKVMGQNNKLPWDIPEDLEYFRKTTAGHAVVMGRKTHESIGRPLPKRPNIIVTRDVTKAYPGCIVVNSLEAGIAKAREVEQEEIFVIGGAELFKQAMPIADRLYLTVVHAQVDGDIHFPDHSSFTKVVSQRDGKDANFSYTFYVLER